MKWWAPLDLHQDPLPQGEVSSELRREAREGFDERDAQDDLVLSAALPTELPLILAA